MVWVGWIPGIPLCERDCNLRAPLESQTTNPNQQLTLVDDFLFKKGNITHKVCQLSSNNIYTYILTINSTSFGKKVIPQRTTKWDKNSKNRLPFFLNEHPPLQRSAKRYAYVSMVTVCFLGTSAPRSLPNEDCNLLECPRKLVNG